MPLGFPFLAFGNTHMYRKQKHNHVKFYQLENKTSKKFSKKCVSAGKWGLFIMHAGRRRPQQSSPSAEIWVPCSEAHNQILSITEVSQSLLRCHIPWSVQEIVQLMLAHFMHFMVFPIKWFCPPSNTKKKCSHSTVASPVEETTDLLLLNSSIRHNKPMW